MKGILELAGAVSHELKQPMQAIFSTIDLMELKNTIDEAEKGKRMEAIVDFIDRMKDIINRLNNLTKYETRPYTGTTINYSHLKANWNSSGLEQSVTWIKTQPGMPSPAF